MPGGRLKGLGAFGRLAGLGQVGEELAWPGVAWNKAFSGALRRAGWTVLGPS